MNLSCLAYNQPDDFNNSSISVLEEYRTGLMSMRNLILHEKSQLKITSSTIDFLERELSDIIRGIDILLNDPRSEEISETLERVQIDVRNARKCLFIASSIPEKTTRVNSIAARFDKYDEFTIILLDSIKLLETIIS